MWHSIELKEIQRKLKTNIYEGLSEEEAKKRKEK